MNDRGGHAHLRLIALLLAATLWPVRASQAATPAVGSSQSYRLALRYSGVTGCGQGGSSSTLKGSIVLKLVKKRAWLKVDLRGSTVSWTSPARKNTSRRAWGLQERYHGSVERRGGALVLRLKLRWPTAGAGVAASLLQPARARPLTLRCRAARFMLTRRPSPSSKGPLRRRVARGLRCAVSRAALTPHPGLRAAEVSGELRLGAGPGLAADVSAAMFFANKGTFYRR